uniref:7TM_GPCR_Srx domain-containing protein n=1 Tax=Heterorhabditis bacteriophora TaxID=37862 RepID=A0A1I7W826_HETBA
MINAVLLCNHIISITCALVCLQYSSANIIVVKYEVQQLRVVKHLISIFCTFKCYVYFKTPNVCDDAPQRLAQITTILSKLTEQFFLILTLFCFKLIIFNEASLSFLQKREYLAHKICKLLFIIHSIFIFSTYIFQFPVSILKNLIFPLHCFLFSKHSFSENMKFNEILKIYLILHLKSDGNQLIQLFLLVSVFFMISILCFHLSSYTGLTWDFAWPIRRYNSTLPLRTTFVRKWGSNGYTGQVNKVLEYEFVKKFVNTTIKAINIISVVIHSFSSLFFYFATYYVVSFKATNYCKIHCLLYMLFI